MSQAKCLIGAAVLELSKEKYLTMETKNLTIMFTDMKGFTSQTAKRSRREIEKLINLQDQLVLPIIERFGGEVVKTIGDSYLVTFDSPTAAVLCGVKIVEVTAPDFELRVAINTGEVNVKAGDIFGEPVNLAARLETVAEAGEVYLAEAAYLAMNKNEIPLTYMGKRTFKGISQPVKIYKVLLKRGVWEAIRNWLALGYWRLAPLALASLMIVGLLLYGAEQTFRNHAEPTDVLSSETIATPTPSLTPAPTLPPQIIIIKEVLVTPQPTPSTQPTSSPSPTPIPVKNGHKWQN